MELRERMVLTKEGQVTWADPSIGKKCVECSHCIKKFDKGVTHICDLVKLHTGKAGKPYDALRAIACSKFAPVDTVETK